MASEHGVNLVEHIVGADAEALVSAALVAGLLCTGALACRRQLARASDPLVPDRRLTLRNLGELCAELILKLGDTVMGPENRKYLPFVGSLFFYIFALNLFGLIPGMSMPTDKVQFNLGIAFVVFVLYNAWGIREVGIGAYLKHLWGPVFLLGPLLFVIEIISHFVRPLALSLRLFGNMKGDHMVLEQFTTLTKLFIPVAFYFLGAFVCFMQAFIFTLLTMVYIRLAVAHEEGHGEHGDGHAGG